MDNPDLIMLYGRQGQHRKAILLIKEDLTAKPNDELLHSMLANAFLNLDQSEDAESSARLAVSLELNAYRLHLLARILQRQRRDTEALETLEAAPGLSPDDPTFHVELGISLERLGHPADAKVSFRKALALGPSEHYNWFALAEILRKMGKLDDAAAMIREAILISPQSGRLYSSLAQIRLDQHRFLEAEEAALTGLRLSPDSPALEGLLKVIRGELTR